MPKSTIHGFATVLPGQWTAAGALVLTNGLGTEHDPHRIALAYRHAIMLDETPVSEAYSQVAAIAREIFASLATINGSDSDHYLSSLLEVLVAVNRTALEAGTYFSAAVGFGVGDSLYAASIGDVSAWVCDESGDLQRWLAPTINQHPRVLTAALGEGFASKNVQMGSISLRSGQSAVFAVQGGNPRGVDVTAITHLPGDRVARLLDRFDPPPAALAIFE